MMTLRTIDPPEGADLAKAVRAVICDAVYYRDEAAHLYVAPRGEYDVCRTCDGLIAFCHSETSEAFALSMDAVGQHVCEGRIRMPQGKIPDEG